MGFLLYHDQKNDQTASADVGLIFTAYNLRRIFNLIDQNLLKQHLKVLALYFGVLTSVFNAFYGLFCFKNHQPTFIRKNFNYSLNHIYLLTD